MQGEPLAKAENEDSGKESSLIDNSLTINGLR